MSGKLKDQEQYDVLMKSEGSKPATFEEAIEASGFGKFNVLLMCIAIPCSFVQIIEQVSVSYVVPIAQCDLDLSLHDKGILISVGYIGMLTTGIFWGYICDTYGRRKIMIYGYLLNSLCYVIASFAQTFTVLLVARFLSGIMFTGPFSALTSYLSEFHSTTKRAKVQLVRGMAGSIAIICLPLLGWAILPTNTKFVIANSINYQSWNIFLAVCSIPALLSSIIFIFMPESPKFLMTQGKNEEALEVFQLVYRVNIGRKNSFPIKSLIVEKEASEKMLETSSIGKQLQMGLEAVKPLFVRPYIFTLIHVCVNVFALLTGIFGLKMWYPQLLQSINDYEKQYGDDKISICSVVESMTHRNQSASGHCTVNLDNSSVYINASILGAIHLTIFTLAGLAVNKLGKKTLVVLILMISAVCPMAIYFISNATLMLALFPVILAIGEASGNILLTVTLEIFPTNFRITALNIYLTSARLATAVTNLIFPFLLMSGCLSVLMFISLCITVTVILTTMLPSTENKALQ